MRLSVVGCIPMFGGWLVGGPLALHAELRVRPGARRLITLVLSCGDMVGSLPLVPQLCDWPMAVLVPFDADVSGVDGAVRVAADIVGSIKPSSTTPPVLQHRPM